MADLREIEALARLRLTGADVRVAVPADVRDLIRFCGLEDVLSPLYAPLRPRHWTRVDEVGATWPRRRAAPAARTAGRASPCRGRS